MTDRFENDHTRHPDWIVETRAWCPECCCRSCGCPTGERIIEEELHLIRGTD